MIPKAIIFDLGRVIVDVDFTDCVNNLFGVGSDADSTDILEQVMSDDSVVKYCSGQISPQAFYRLLKAKYGFSVDFEGFKEQWCGIFFPMPDSEKLLAELVGKVKLGLLSDTDPLHWEYVLEKYPIFQVFERPTLSFQIGCMKPARQAYVMAAESVQQPLCSCLFIDDRLKNVEGARSAGMDAIHFTGIDGLRAELEKREVL